MKLYGIAEIAEELGQRRETVGQWHARGKLPPPDAELAMGPVWTGRTISPWLHAQRRRLSQVPSTTSARSERARRRQR